MEDFGEKSSHMVLDLTADVGSGKEEISVPPDKTPHNSRESLIKPPPRPTVNRKNSRANNQTTPAANEATSSADAAATSASAGDSSEIAAVANTSANHVDVDTSAPKRSATAFNFQTSGQNPRRDIVKRQSS